MGKRPLAQALSRLLRIAEELLEQPRSRDYLSTLDQALRDPTSVTRDIKTLRELGWQVRSGGRRPYTIETAGIPLLVSPEEARALRYGLELASQTSLPEAAAFEALLARVPPGVRKVAFQEDATVGYSSPVADYRSHRNTIEALKRAIARGRRCEIAHQMPGYSLAKIHLIDAAELDWVEDSLILFAFCPALEGKSDDERTREFRVERIKAVNVRGEACTLAQPPRFEFTYRLGAVLSTAFTPSDNHRILERTPAGDLIIEGRLTSLLRARRYLLSYGPDAEALAPERLRGDLASQARRMSTIYGEGGSGKRTPESGDRQEGAAQVPRAGAPPVVDPQPQDTPR